MKFDTNSLSNHGLSLYVVNISIKVGLSNKMNIKVGFTSDCSLPISSSSATLVTHQMQWQV